MFETCCWKDLVLCCKILILKHRGQAFLVVSEQVCGHIRRNFGLLVFANFCKSLRCCDFCLTTLSFIAPNSLYKRFSIGFRDLWATP